MRRVAETPPATSPGSATSPSPSTSVADVERALGDTATALAAYEESLAISRKLATLDATNVQWQTDLVVGLYKIALMTGDDKKAASVDEAIKIVERLDAEGKLSPDKKNWKDMLLALRAGPQAQ